MPNRSQDWLRQSLRDLEQVEDCLRDQRYEWACFAAHQAAEKAVKALHLYLGQEAWGHVIASLLQELPGTVSLPEGLMDKGRALDNFYIPTRYPNGHPAGAPFEHYGELQGGQALEYAREIIALVRAQMA